MLAQPAQSLTDLALGVVTIVLGLRLRRVPARHGYWRAAFWCFGVAALAGAVHHGVIVRWVLPRDVSWALISLVVVVAVSFMLAATVADVLGPGRGRSFWLLRVLGLLAYITNAVTGRSGVSAILWCESLTMLSVVALWVWAAYLRDPVAPAVVAAMAASIGAAAANLLDPALLRPIRLDPMSAYHLAQIVGMVLLYAAVRRLVPDRPLAVSEPGRSDRLARPNAV
jgi:hypothetical protein